MDFIVASSYIIILYTLFAFLPLPRCPPSFCCFHSSPKLSPSLLWHAFHYSFSLSLTFLKIPYYPAMISMVVLDTQTCKCTQTFKFMFSIWQKTWHLLPYVWLVALNSFHFLLLSWNVTLSFSLGLLRIPLCKFSTWSLSSAGRHGSGSVNRVLFRVQNGHARLSLWDCALSPLSIHLRDCSWITQ